MSTVTWFCLPHKWVVTIQVQRELANKSLCFFAGVTVIREYRIMASPGENVNMLQKDLPFNPLLLWFAMWSEQWQDRWWAFGSWIFFFGKRSWIMELQLRIRIRIKMPASRQELRFFENGHCFFSPGYYLLLTKKQDNSEFWCPMRVQIVRESQGISICVSVRVLVQKRRIQTFREHGQGWPCGRAPLQSPWLTVYC